MMRSGKLRHRIDIVSKGQAQGGTHGDVQDTTVTLFSSVPAHVEELRGREFYQAQQINTEITTKVSVRYLPGVTRSHRVVWGSETYEIVRAIPDERARWMIVYCKAVV